MKNKVIIVNNTPNQYKRIMTAIQFNKCVNERGKMLRNVNKKQKSNQYSK